MWCNIWEIFVSILYVSQNNVYSAGMEFSILCKLTEPACSCCSSFHVFIDSCLLDLNISEWYVKISHFSVNFWFSQFLLYILCFDAMQLGVYINLELMSQTSSCSPSLISYNAFYLTLPLFLINIPAPICFD